MSSRCSYTKILFETLSKNVLRYLFRSIKNSFYFNWRVVDTGGKILNDQISIKFSIKITWKSAVIGAIYLKNPFHLVSSGICFRIQTDKLAILKIAFF